VVGDAVVGTVVTGTVKYRGFEKKDLWGEVSSKILS
jgi:hypothetical protein